jgi:hypothetical protein
VRSLHPAVKRQCSGRSLGARSGISSQSLVSDRYRRAITIHLLIEMLMHVGQLRDQCKITEIALDACRSDPTNFGSLNFAVNSVSGSGLFPQPSLVSTMRRLVYGCATVRSSNGTRSPTRAFVFRRGTVVSQSRRCARTPVRGAAGCRRDSDPHTAGPAVVERRLRPQRNVELEKPSVVEHRGAAANRKRRPLPLRRMQ